MRRSLSGLLLGLFVAVGAGFVPAPAQAAYCSGSTGVSVVVDFGALGGGVQKGCATGVSTASAAFTGAGFSLTRVQRFPGAVCRVAGEPANAPCYNMPPEDAYWGLFSSHGSGWTYASVSVDSLKVSNGDTVAFAWQSSSARRFPGTSPWVASAPAPAPKPAPAPAPKPAPKPSPAPGGVTTPSTKPVPSASGLPTISGSPTPSAKGISKPSKDASAMPGATNTPTATTTSAPTSSAGSAAEQDLPNSDKGLPGWVPVAVIALLAIAGGAVALIRRRS